MSPFFDAPPQPSHDVVLFTHDRKSDGLQKPDGIPSRGNHGGTLDETLEFLASGATIVTNSYHGVYWGMCLGRRVLCLPYSSKFEGFLIPPVVADPANWLKDLFKAESRPDILPHARSANQVFYEMVMNLA
ncbi:hypothetical protein O2N63_00710 [Aliiroseovarius sp. KMU-50]|uniref:Polysaccharide pyruvyl transferase domain-containing protein n=1 Tax=Aliiroseovarius salicola TaxID=3009082 RepID=A0ABT4VWJ0_9RHOB|nr:hypothetical protein [Aliiroseovarius sp. KMU-50]MDA5092609.1 hypothetical protein [Aliiroseovarius sp. KMU-50]